jgi:hypothetical protein
VEATLNHIVKRSPFPLIAPLVAKEKFVVPALGLAKVLVAPFKK